MDIADPQIAPNIDMYFDWFVSALRYLGNFASVQVARKNVTRLSGNGGLGDI